MLSSSGPGGVDEVSVRKWVTLSVKEHIAKVQEAQDQLRIETTAQLQDFSTTLTKLESAMQQAVSTVKRTQESCKYVNKELETLRAIQKATAEHQAETLMREVEEAIKSVREAAEKDLEQMTQTQTQMQYASVKASQELEALQQEMRAQQLSGALFSLRATKLTEQRRVELIRELEQQQAGLPQHFDRIAAENVQIQLPLPSRGPAGQGSLKPQASASSGQAYSPLPTSSASAGQPTPSASAGQSSSQPPASSVATQEIAGSRETKAMSVLETRLDKLEWNLELQQLAANIFCLRMMDSDSKLRESCLEKLEKKHKDLSDYGRIETL